MTMFSYHIHSQPSELHALIDEPIKCGYKTDVFFECGATKTNWIWNWEFIINRCFGSIGAATTSVLKIAYRLLILGSHKMVKQKTVTSNWFVNNKLLFNASILTSTSWVFCCWFDHEIKMPSLTLEKKNSSTKRKNGENELEHL